ncbi:hypothetical protein B4589_012460 [Halolamina sp. CBA1230]|uniref:hypothetical protein n=1 Tax=Halolamina sp. CBA1230 TaxID=1853690 RepID=UPI0009A1F438|nr:hypothetical protein [Halolamina sp. CBA1230]QKY21145.1 hypothetical protein B4589_012460 [Halolamina sp. CBA1230]
MRKPVPAVALAAAILLAGCIGGVGTDGSATATQTATETPTVTPPTSTDESERVVAYEDLNDQQQAAFRDAIDGEASFVPNTSYVNDSAGYEFEHVDPFQEHEYVRYDGDQYRISTTQGELYASYQIRTSVGSPDENATVVALEELPDRVRDEVRTAIIEGEYYAPYGKWGSLPESLQDAEYVRYENRTYETGYAVGDAWATVVTVEEVE